MREFSIGGWRLKLKPLPDTNLIYAVSPMGTVISDRIKSPILAAAKFEELKILLEKGTIRRQSAMREALTGSTKKLMCRSVRIKSVFPCKIRTK